MNKNEQREELERAFHEVAPILRRWAKAPKAEMPPHMLKALREDLDRHHPTPPPMQEELAEIALLLLAEQSMQPDDLVTALRLRSHRVNDQHVAELINLLMGHGLIEEDLKASASLPSSAYRASSATRKMLGLSNTREKIRSLLEND